jgi:beta propeller repeat protein
MDNDPFRVRKESSVRGTVLLSLQDDFATAMRSIDLNGGMSTLENSQEGSKMKKIRRNRIDGQVGRTCFSMILVVTLTAILSGVLSGLVSRSANAQAIQFYESRITSDPASQVNPAIYGDTIVYQDDRNGNWDIYMVKYGYAETRITTNTADQTNPRIYGDKMVYQDTRNGAPDIYMYDLSTHTETQITNNPLAQEYPAIDGNRIVWQDSRNTNWDSGVVTWDVYMYDLSTQTETRVTVSGSTTPPHPAISGNLIAYIRGVDVYYFDLSTGSEVRLTQFPTWNGQSAGSPAVYGSHILWHQTFAQPGSWRDIYTIDVATGAVWSTIPLADADRICPDMSEVYPGFGYIVYRESGHVYLYHTAEQAEYQVTRATGNQINPRVSNGYIVYQDDRNGNWDIYLTMVGYGPGAPPSSSPAVAMQNVEIVGRLMAHPAHIPASHIDGASLKVKENRRNALLNKIDAVIATIQAAVDSTDPVGRAAHYQGAIEQLDSILDKTDGCALRGAPDAKGSRYTPDWIIACESQELIEPLITYSITMLQTLLELI